MIARLWYGNSALRWPLWPISWLYRALTGCRRAWYRFGTGRVTRLPVPVIVVGNLTVGGAGKTPVVLWLAAQLRSAGWRPGIVSRGYKGKATSWPQRVSADSDPGWLGDEPVLLAQRSGCPVAVGPDRAAAAEMLLGECDIVVADDGLQHYALARDFELAVIDGERGLGNGLCLPAGPLREPPGRLATVGAVLINGGSYQVAGPRVWRGCLQADAAHHLASDATRPLGAFRSAPVHAVAGIGNPLRFFRMLQRAGLEVSGHPLADHAIISQRDLVFADDRAVLMTEKDAVKARSLDVARHWWYVPVDFVLASADGAALLDAIETAVGQPPRGD